MKKASPANFPQLEDDMLAIWERENTFEKSLAQRKDQPRFSFYDGPPFANGLPHYGHVVGLSIKDSMTRYKTMRGYYVPRRNGWDTHGLPVEFELEKQLKLSGKRQILEYGVENFNQAARESVFKYKREWQVLQRRIGRWADQKNSYATMDDNYIESVWSVLAQLNNKDLIYRGFRSNPYCPRCATPLSNFEVNQNYKDNVPDPSVYVKFQLVDDANTSLLAWTTTPWTLPANAALAVSSEAEYVTVELNDDGDSWHKGERLILAKSRLGELELRKAEYKVVDATTGRNLVGKHYTPLYRFGAGEHSKQLENAWQVYADDSVSLDDGTGVLHVAPRYGETDLALGIREDLPLIESVDANGMMVDDFTTLTGLEQIAGSFFKKADAQIIADLTEKGRLFAAETFEHTYPFCWRCETPLMYFAIQTWYIKMSELQDRLVKTNNQVNWVPAHVKQGRFGNWLADARDWNFSRNRFWGAPIPIWVNVNDQDDYIVVGSLDELRNLSGQAGNFDLHRPGIDVVEIKRDGKIYKRIEEVFDCWFESGSMPYAQNHYPFEHKDQFKQEFPADFIAEGLDQTRGWFYTLHALSTALFDQPAFKNVVVNGLVLAADGKKLSKRLRNYPDPSEIFEKYGADSLRLFLLSSPVVAGEDVRFSADAVGEVSRNVFMRLWNVYSFFSTYAEVDRWEPANTLIQPKSESVLDRWLLARLNQTVEEMTKQADQYQIAPAVRPLREFIDDLSNWYVRRSRRRFWKSEDDSDKQSAYTTLHYVLARVAQLLAPWSPFVADRLWRELTVGMEEPSSVHLSDWPEAGEINSNVLRVMSNARQIVNAGLALRAEAGIKVRQPLAVATVKGNVTLDPYTLDIVADELNVKRVVVPVKDLADGVKYDSHVEVALDTKVTPELAREGMMRDVVRLVQKARKDAGLNVDDRIELALKAEQTELRQAIEEYSELIGAETLANGLADTADGGFEVIAKINGHELIIILKARA